jgi:hypothetical protein
VRRGKKQADATESGQLVCERDGNPTTLRCAKCSRPICPTCLVQTPVGFTCDAHEGKPVYRADDLPLTPADRPLRGPGPPAPPLAPLVLLVAVPLVTVLLRAGSRGGSATAGLLVALPALALSAWFVLRRFRRG